MKYAAFAVVLVLVVVFSSMALAIPSVQQERDLIEATSNDVETSRAALELAARILRAARMSPFGYAGGFQTGMAKRNSELINSLLGLPKVMNDAGRK